MSHAGSAAKNSNPATSFFSTCEQAVTWSPVWMLVGPVIGSNIRWMSTVGIMIGGQLALCYTRVLSAVVEHEPRIEALTKFLTSYMSKTI